MTAHVTVIVVNFNSGTLARRCLETAAADLSGVEWNAIVVDNASADGSAAVLKHLPKTTLVENLENAGFGRAVNQAARAVEGVGTRDSGVRGLGGSGARDSGLGIRDSGVRGLGGSGVRDSGLGTRDSGSGIQDQGSGIRDSLFWLLNPDCEVIPGAFAELRRVLDRHDDCAIAAPQLVNADGSVQASARGEPTAWTGLFGRHSFLSRIFPSSAEARRNLPARDLVAAGVDSAHVDWVMGAAMLIRADRFRQVGGFDERYFLYWEDADLCRRLRHAGYTTRYVPGARVRHPGGASAKTASRLATRAFHESAYLYYATHVVPSPWHPARWIAKVGLTTRAWWRMRRGPSA